MSFVKVLAAGVFTTVQDLGRPGWQRYGVPVSGAFDRVAAAMANALVDNEPSAALLEMTYSGPHLVTEVPLVAAFAGAQARACLEDTEVAPWQSFLWLPGQELNLGALEGGSRSYLAVSGGWRVPEIMGSRSTTVQACLGGYRGRHLQKDDRLPVAPPSLLPAAGRRLPQAWRPPQPSPLYLRFVPGPQEDYFDQGAVDALARELYRVSDKADRMGVRLQGPPLLPLRSDIISDAIALGSIQIPADGQPIIMGPDRQTTGGYPKLGTVIGPDMDLLAQAMPGSPVRFQPLTVYEAQHLLRHYRQKLQEMRKVADNTIKGREMRVRIDDEVFYTFVERL